MKSPRDLQSIANILGGIPILGVLPESPADRAGLRYGDIVTSVNGAPTATFEAFLKAHDSGREVLSLEVFRDGERFRLDMVLPKRSQPASEAADTLSRIPIYGKGRLPCQLS
jgi:S1-C subfamily serine protease